MKPIVENNLIIESNTILFFEFTLRHTDLF